MPSLNNQFFLLRHAEVDRSKNVHFSQYELSPKGHAQALDIIPVLRALEIDFIFASPFTRAIQTIEPFSRESMIQFTIDERLSGRKVGNLPKEETWDFFQKSWNDFQYTKHGAESAQECTSRVQNFICEQDEIHNGKNILIVTHSNPIAFYLNSIDSSVDYHWFKSMRAPSLYQISSEQNENYYCEQKLFND